VRLKTILAVTLLSCFIIEIPLLILAQDSILSDDYDSKINTLNTPARVPGLPKIPGSHEYMDIEPGSNGEVYIYEAGMNHPVSKR